MTAQADIPLEPADGLPDWMLRLVAAAPHATPFPPSFRPPGRGRPAAVLLLFGISPGPDGADQPDVLLIERARDLRAHAGQPAFPGGALDETDAGPIAAALREAQEETGLDPAGVQPVALLPDIPMTVTSFRVTPVLAYWREPSAVAPGHPAEVAAVARVPLSDLVDPANRLAVRTMGRWVGPAFRVADLLVWGMTAGLLDSLLDRAGLAVPWDRSHVEELPPATLGIPDNLGTEG